jgi:hypothetical protein
MTDTLEDKAYQILECARWCGAVVLDFDLEQDEYVVIWCGPGILMVLDVDLEKSAEDFGLETLALIHISDDPEFNGTDEVPPDSPFWDFPQIGELTPAQRSQTCLWVDDEKALAVANPQRFSH